MSNSFMRAESERRAAHMRQARERARSSSEIRVSSVVGAYGALFTSLRRGSFQARDRLDEASLIPMFSASRNSIRGALKLLAEEGLVSRSPKRGTAVVAQVLDVPLSTGTGWGPPVGEQVATDGSGSRSQLIVTDERFVAATPVSRRFLGTTGDWVHQTEVTDLLDGKPALLYTRFTLAEGAHRPLVTGPADGDFGELFERTYGSSLGQVDCWVEAKPASKRAAARLSVAVGTPLIVKSRVLRDADGVPREYSISHYLASRVNMSAHTAGERTSTDIATPPPSARQRAASAEVSPSGELRRRSAVDLHTELRAAIRDGLLRVGERLDEEAIALSFGSVRETVRETLSQLVQEGVLTRTPDAGTVVAAAISKFDLASGRPYRAAEQPHFHSEMLSSTRVPVPPFLVGVVDADAGRVHRDEHVSYRDERPLMIFVRYSDGRLAAPRPLTSQIGNSDFASLFTKSYGLPPGRIDSWVHAVRADRQIARRLDVPAGTVMLHLERVTHDARGVVRELSHLYIRAESVSLHIHHDVVHQAQLPA